jgi:hypothetical protein
VPTFDIRVSGGAYTTAVAAEAGTNTGTLSGGETRGQYQGTWGSGDVDAGGQITIAGATVTSTNYWALDADSPNTIQSSWQTGRAKMVGNSSSELIRCAQSYTRIRGIQAENTGTGTRVVQHFNSALILCDSCFMRGRGGWSGRAAGETGYCVNSIASNGGAQTLRIGHESSNASGTSHLYYCIAVNGGTNASFLNTSGTLNTTGCVAYGHSVDSWSGTSGGDYNASDRTDAPGANSLQSIGSPFVNYAGGNFALDPSGAASFIGAGGAPPGGTYPVTTDAFGTTRLNPTTIGWQELGSSGVSGVGAATPGSLDLGASGAVALAGEGAAPPGAVGLTAEGGPEVAGQGAPNPDALGLQAAGAVNVAGAGVAAPSSLGLAGAAVLEVEGQGAAAPDAVGLDATAGEGAAVEGLAAPDALGLTAAGKLDVAGQGAAAPQALGIDAVGTVALAGQGTVSPGVVGLDASAVVGEAPEPTAEIVRLAVTRASRNLSTTRAASSKLSCTRARGVVLSTTWSDDP